MAINLDHVTEQITVTDTAANASLTVQPKGTGAFNIAAGSSGVNISNGGTVTAITKTGTGNNYTSVPTWTASAPTTAGGTQASGTATMQYNSATVVSGGTGYTVNDVLSVVGGTATAGTQTMRVTAVSGGVITAVVYNSGGAYTVLPSNPVSVTGGTGSGATFTIDWGVYQLAIAVAGSGYVEQPTVTFSGGGGSGAAAYATVGSGTTVRSLGASIETLVDTTTILHLRAKNTSGGNPTNTSAAFGLIPPQSNFGAPVMGFISGPYFSWGGTGAMSFSSNASNPAISGNSGSEQFRISHTASAVNYVQVTGAATGSGPIISAQGSDTDIRLNLTSKGTNSIDMLTNSAGTRQFRFAHTASAVNYLQATGGATGFGPVLSAQGSDTNIPAVVQPKGTGALQAQQTDSTATGGNARGANAVDWQTARDTAARVASGAYSIVVGGYGNTSNGTVTTVVGGNSNAVGGTYAGILSGISNTASGFSSGIVSGYTNSANGFLNFVGGGYTNSGTSGSAVTTQSATMNGTTAVTLSGSNASIKVGQLITGTSIQSFPHTYVAAISGTSLTLSQAATGSSTSTLSFYTPHGVVVGGGNNQATGSYSFIGGGGDAGTAANRNVASGAWSSVVGGVQNTASGDYSAVLGGANTSATGAYSVTLGGAGNTASGFGATNLGGNGNTANGTYAVASGYQSTNRSISGFSFAAGGASRIGDAQIEFFVLRNSTTDATATVLTLGAGAPSTTNQVILPNNSAYYFKVEIIANVTGGGNTSGWELKGVIKRGANAASTTIVGSVTSTLIAQDAGASTWAVSATADTTNGGLKITCTGQASTTIRWVAKASTTEVTF